MDSASVYRYTFASIYRLYEQKVLRKNRTQADLDTVICWLTGYTSNDLQRMLDSTLNLQDFFENAPQFNPNASKITGLICGYRVEEIEDPMMQKIRYMDKLVDELAKGKKLEKILRS